MSVEPHYDTMMEWALHYARAKFLVFPVNADKSPLSINGFYDGTTDVERITKWWTKWPSALVGCRVPDDVVILDIDPRHKGDDVWAALQDEHGPIITSREHRSGRNDGGRQYWFTRPAGQLAIKPLTEWARTRGVGEKVGISGWTCGIDILHHTQRYTILPPSLHPATGQPYTWANKTKPVPMAPWLAQLITKQPTPPPPPRASLRPADSDSVADWYSQTHTWNEILGAAGWELVSGDGDGDGSKWRHPNASAATSSSIKHGCLFVYTPNTEFEQTEEGDRHGYTRFRAYAVLEHGGDQTAAARAAHSMRDPFKSGTSARKPPANVDPATGEIIQPEGRILGDEFWNARPYLAHIRQAALSRMVAPAAVLGCVLARVAAFTPPSVCLPPLIGDSVGLGTIVALYARSGGGKTTAAGCASALLPDVPPGCIGPLPLGSGEGLIDAYFEMIDDVDGAGKKSKVKRQTKYGALFMLDEGQVLAELGRRNGSTTTSTIRSAWMGTHLGQANASAETKRIMRPGSYSFGLISLWQLDAAMRLLEDATGGTPQRFVWFNTVSDEITVDTPEWPGQLGWKPPPAIIMGGIMQPNPMGLHPDVAQPIKAQRAAVGRGELEVDPLDTHRNLAMLKVAGVLAVLDGRHNVDLEDWRLAGLILAHSDDIRSWVIAEDQRRRQATEEAKIKATVAREALVEGSAEQRALAQAAKAAFRAAQRATDGVVGRRQVHMAMASRVRQMVTVEDAIAEAERLQWVVSAGPDSWRIGASKPS